MDHCGLGVLVQDFVLLCFVTGKQEQEEVNKTKAVFGGRGCFNFHALLGFFFFFYILFFLFNMIWEFDVGTDW